MDKTPSRHILCFASHGIINVFDQQYILKWDFQTEAYINKLSVFSSLILSLDNSWAFSSFV